MRDVRLIALDEKAKKLVIDALQQWAEEYATVEEHALAHRIIDRLNEPGVPLYAGSTGED